jgi:hypothetical protein
VEEAAAFPEPLVQLEVVVVVAGVEQSLGFFGPLGLYQILSIFR